MEKARFAAGCFWGVEYEFSQLNGVVKTKAGYSGGFLDNPSYNQVCNNNTGHAESVEIEFDENKVSYSDLLNFFWKIHDPTSLNRQGPDIGTQYRSVIFYFNKQQKKEAEKSKKDYEAKIGEKIVTEIVKAEDFWEAEEYHQKYYEKNEGSKCEFS